MKKEIDESFGNTETKMTDFVNELIQDINVDSKKELTTYQNKLLTQKIKRFDEIVKHNFNGDIVTLHVGDESRTFHKIDQSKPLLSPSRILKVFTEHKFWRIPQKNLLKPRLMGQLVHKLLELRIMNKQIIKLDRDNFMELVGKDYEIINKDWSDEKINLFIDEVNEATNNIYNYLNLKRIKVLECEKHIANFEYHGYADIVGYKVSENNNFKIPVIIDLKITSNKEVTNEYVLQLAIYRQIFEKTAQCYILFYDRDSKEARLEKIQWAVLDEVYDKINTLVKLFRK